MKTIVTLFALLVATSPLLAGDPAKGTSYTATMSGMVCGSCKAHVTDALMKLPGVTAVEITKGEAENTQKVTFASQTETLTKQDAINALGESASRYQVLTLDKTK